MIPNKFVLSLLLLGSFLVAPSPSKAESGAVHKRIMLITEDEAAEPDEKPTTSFLGSGGEEASDGPSIEFNSPTPDTTVPKPVRIAISFQENQAPIDFSSLEVKYLKFISIDITDRIKPFVTPKGIDIQNADLPTGTHKVRFSIKDKKDNLTERTLKLTITEAS